MPQSGVELMIACMFPLLISNRFVTINPFSLKSFPWAFSVVRNVSCLSFFHVENILLLLSKNVSFLVLETSVKLKSLTNQGSHIVDYVLYFI